MNTTYMRIIAVAALLFYLTSCDKSTTDANEAVTDKDTTKVHHTKDNAYEGLRNMAFSMTPEQLGLSLPADKIIVYGIIMDWDMDGTATTVAYQTGDASLYLSSGGGVVGGGQHKNVNEVAMRFVELGQTFLDKATKTDITALPAKDEVKFYLLTNKGIYLGQEQMKNFGIGSSPWQQLFVEGNNLLTELREMSTK